MKPHIFLAASLAALLPIQAHAAIIVYKANLTGAAEAPPNASPAIGKATVTIDDVAKTMRVQANFSGLLGPVTAAHIHCCTPVTGAGAAGVATSVPTFPGFPGGVTAGTYDHFFDMTDPASWNPTFVASRGGTPQSAFDALTLGMSQGRTYFNIHTQAFPGGEIRGFLTAPAGGVPEPAAWAMILSGFGLAGTALRRRQASVRKLSITRFRPA